MEKIRFGFNMDPNPLVQESAPVPTEGQAKLIDEDKHGACHNWLRRMLSPYGLNSSPAFVGFVSYEIASSVLNLSFAFLLPLLVEKQAEEFYGDGQGKIWAAGVSVGISIFTMYGYISFLSLLDYGLYRRKTLIISSKVTALSMVLVLFCFHSSLVIVTCILWLIGKVVSRMADVAFAALIDAVAGSETEAHDLSTRSQGTGYIGLGIFVLLVLGPVLGTIYLISGTSIWFSALIPNALVGLWSVFFVYYMSSLLPLELGQRPPLVLVPLSSTSIVKSDSTGEGNEYEIEIDKDKNKDENVDSVRVASTTEAEDSYTNKLPFYKFAYHATVLGVTEQCKSVIYLKTLGPDLQWLFISYIFLNGATNTASSAAAILCIRVLKISIAWVALGSALGTIAAVAFLALYRYLTKHGFMSVHQVLILNLIILSIGAFFALFVERPWELVIMMIICGSQLGSFGSFSRSLVSTLVPSSHQSRLFSLFELIKDGTSWIGPLILATLTSHFGDNSYQTILVLVCFFQIIIGLPILGFLVNVERGRSRREEEDETDKKEEFKRNRSSSNLSTRALVQGIP